MITETRDVKLGNGSVKSIARVYSLPNSNRRQAQYELLRVLAENPDLSHCKLQPFQRLTIYHDGERWIAEAEVVTGEG